MTSPILTGLAPSVTFAENTVNAAAGLLFRDVTLTDPEGFAGGVLRVTGLLAEDTVSVLDRGTGAGAIGLSGGSVTFGGAVIGTLTGGVGAELRIDLGAGATAAAVEALIEAITYANASDSPTADRTLRLHLADASGAVPAVITEATGAANPFNGVDVGFTGAPDFADIDGDGDLDAVVGADDGTLHTFIKDGAGAYAKLTGAANPFNGVNVGFSAIPAFFNFHGDGLLDAVVGADDGTLRSFVNNGAAGFAELTGAANPFNGIDVGSRSAPAFADIVGDGFVDLMVGAGDGTLRVFAGSAGAVFTQVTGAANPFNGVDVGASSAPAFTDVDGDGDLDVVVGAADGTLRLWDNDGAGGFAQLVGAANPYDGLDVGAASAPAFADVDGDGDMDAVVGEFYGTLRTFQNDGDAGIAVAVAVTPEDDAPVVTGLPPAVTFGENAVNAAPQRLFGNIALTDDSSLGGGALRVTGLLAEDTISVLDGGSGAGVIGLSGGSVTYGGAVIGTLTGGVGAEMRVDLGAGADAATVEALIESITFANASDTPTADRTLRLHLTDAAGAGIGLSTFTELTGAANPLGGVDAGDWSAPGFADLDGDGDLDAVVGEFYGALRAYENDGAGGFAELTGAANPLGGVNVTRSSAPAFMDLDGDGDRDAVVGTAFGTLRSFANDGAGGFAELTGAANPFNGIDVGGYATPAIADIDGDGKLDMVVGDESGTLRTYADNGAGGFSELTGAANPFAGVDVGLESAPALVDLDNDGDVDAVVGDKNGTLRSFVNDGVGGFTQLVGDANPLTGVDVGTKSKPAFADIDGDGDMDAVVGESDGTLRAFENDGVAGIAVAVTVTAENDAPVLTGLAQSAAFDENTVNDAPQLLFGDVTLTDPEGIAGGVLRVTGLLAEDSVSVLDGGMIAVSGGSVTYGGAVIGTLTGGIGTELRIDLSAGATLAAVETLIESLAYANASHTPTEARTLRLHLTDWDGGGVGTTVFRDLAGAANPFNTVDLPWSAPALIDLDDDGDLDAVVGEVYGTLHAYENDGAGGFAALTGAANPFDGLDLGNNSAPAFVDIDRDGDLDAVIGASTGALRVFANDGAGGFAELTGAANPFDGVDVGSLSAPAFMDIDADGDLDAVVGVGDGTLHAFASDGAGGFDELTGAANPFDGVDVGIDSAPAFADIDGDGDLDVLVGDRNGRIIALANDGAGGFSALVGAANPFDGVDVGSLSKPVFGDVDGDGDLDAVIGVGTGAMRTFANDGGGGLAVEVLVAPQNDGHALTGLAPSVELTKNLVATAPQLLFGDVTLIDLDGLVGGVLRVTGLLAEDNISVLDGGAIGIGLSGADVTYDGTVIGTLTGGVGAELRVDLGAGATTAAVEALIEAITYANASGAPTEERALRLHLTDATGVGVGPPAFTERTDYAINIYDFYAGDATAPAFADIDGDGDIDAVVGSTYSVLRTFASDGAGGFDELTGAANPFDGVDPGFYGSPAFADIDGDGDLDLVVGEAYGMLRSFANDGAGGFAELTGAANPFNGVDVGNNSAPAFADIDGDGDIDAVIGAYDGTLHAFISDGAGGFAALTGAANPFTGVDVGDAATPAFVDLDGDGDLDLMVGQRDGALLAFSNDGAGGFSALTGAANPFEGIYFGYQSRPSFGDLDGDGDLDAVVGHYSSGAQRLFGQEQSGLEVTLSLVEDNILPTARDDAFATSERVAISGSVLANNGAGADFDTDGGTLRIAAVNGAAASVGVAVTLASGALLTLRADGTFDYNPTGAFGALMTGETGTDSFTYRLSDGQGGEDEAIATIAISGVTHAPVAQFDLLSTTENGAITRSVFADNGFGADSDLDGDALSVVRVNNSAAGVGQPVTLSSGAQLTLNADGTFDYDPMGAFDWLPGGARVSDSFSYVASDGQALSGISAVILITGINDAPDITTPATFTVAPGETAVGAVAATDAEGDAVSYAIAGGADADLFAIDPATGALSFLAVPVAGDYAVTVAASDGAATAEQAVAINVPPAGTAIGEVVHLTVGTPWQTLTFANTYENAVVFALAPTLNEADSVATRFKNITATGAEIRLQEPKKVYDGTTNPGDHVDEAVTLLVLEAGVHTLEDGTVIQVGEISTNKLYVKGFESIGFAEAFDTTPSIFSQVQTVNGSDFIISRQRNPDGSGFQLTMQEEQADNRNHAIETVGWMAIEHGSGALSTMDWRAGSSAQNVNGKLTNVNFGATFDTAPLVVASLASYNGTDTASPRIGTVSTTKFTAMALEDQSFDFETNHGYEIVDWMAFSNEGTIYAAAAAPLALIAAAPEQVIAETGFADASDAAVTVSFGTQFEHPVVIASLTSMADGAAAIARVFNVTGAGFDLMLQTPDGSAHAPETVSWMVVEAGSWQLADGTMLQAGLTDPGAGFTSVAFDASFADGPAVLSQTQTMDDAAFAKARMQGVDETGFTVAVEGSEAVDAGAETVGWIAVDMGRAAGADGFVFEAGEVTANQKWGADTFAAPLDAPGVVAGMASRNGTDAAAARLGAITDQGFEIRAEEDQTHDAETFHATEDFHWIAFEQGQIWGDALV